MPLPWPSELLPEAALLGFAMAVAGSLIGAWIGARLAADDLPRTRSLRTAAVVASAVVAALRRLRAAEAGRRGRARAGRAPGRAVAGADGRSTATVRFDPPNAADDAEWLTATSWQGGGLVVDRLERVGARRLPDHRADPGHGAWKSMIRLHHGASLTAVPIYLPDDPAIPVKGVPADRRSFTREFDRRPQSCSSASRRPPRRGSGASPTRSSSASRCRSSALLAWGIHRVSTAPVEERDDPPKAEPRPRAASRRL